MALSRKQYLGWIVSVNIGFVVGNGISRQNQPLNKLTDFGTVYACNWASVDLPCDHAVIPDKNTLFRILSERPTNGITVWTKQRWRDLYQHETELHYLPETLYRESQRWDRERHWGAGTHAAWMAAERHDVVVLLGFDLWNSGVNNNVYAGQYDYTHKPVDPACWIYQLTETFRRHPETSFVQIQDDDWQIPNGWQPQNNISTDNYKNLWAMFD